MHGWQAMLVLEGLPAIGLAASAAASDAAVSFAALCLGAVGIWSMFGVFWALPGDFLSGTAAASGFALINSIGAPDGFAGPSLVGFVREGSGTFSAALLVLALRGDHLCLAPESSTADELRLSSASWSRASRNRRALSARS